MLNFTAQDAFRSRWRPGTQGRAVRTCALCAVGLAVVTALAGVAAARMTGLAYGLAAIATAAALAGALACAAAAIVVALAGPLARVLPRLALPIFLLSVVGIVVVAWVPALLYEVTDDARQELALPTAHPALSVTQLETCLSGQPARGNGAWALAAGALWPFQFQLTRDVLAMMGALGLVSLVASFAIWWERKVAGRIQSRLGPMRVGGWHGWAQSIADGLKLVQKEDLVTAGADQPLFRLAPYMVFAPAIALFVALPFSMAWVNRDLDIGLIFIFAMLGIGVVGVLLGGWASNNKWSLLGAMREACQMISYEIPLGFSLLIPVMTVGTLRLTEIGQVQAGGFHTWLAFANPFTLTAALVLFIAMLASCKRAPFDLPEAESELVAGYMTEYSGFRWALFLFAEYGEMLAVGALAAILFFGAWYSPLPAAWGAGLADGALWERALHGVLFSGPLWLIGKALLFIYVQIWIRWTLPRIRLDQVMYACVQVLLPISMVALLGNTFWLLLVPAGSLLATLVTLACTLVGALCVLAGLVIIVRGYRARRELVGTLAVEALPGA